MPTRFSFFLNTTEVPTLFLLKWACMMSFPGTLPGTPYTLYDDDDDDKTMTNIASGVVPSCLHMFLRKRTHKPHLNISQTLEKNEIRLKVRTDAVTPGAADNDSSCINKSFRSRISQLNTSPTLLQGKWMFIRPHCNFTSFQPTLDIRYHKHIFWKKFFLHFILEVELKQRLNLWNSFELRSTKLHGADEKSTRADSPIRTSACLVYCPNSPYLLNLVVLF